MCVCLPPLFSQKQTCTKCARYLSLAQINGLDLVLVETKACVCPQLGGSELICQATSQLEAMNMLGLAYAVCYNMIKADFFCIIIISLFNIWLRFPVLLIFSNFNIHTMCTSNLKEKIFLDLIQLLDGLTYHLTPMRTQRHLNMNLNLQFYFLVTFIF